MVGLVRHRQTKGPATDRPHLNHRATPRLHTLRIGQFHLYDTRVNRALNLCPDNRFYSATMNAASLGFTDVKRYEAKPKDLDNRVDDRCTFDNGGRGCSSRILEVRHSIAGSNGRTRS